MRRHWHGLARWVVLLGGLGVLAWQMPEFVRRMSGLGTELAHLRWQWVVFAAVLSVGSLLLYGELHRQLLVAGRAAVSGSAVQEINLVENALSTTLPAVGNAAGFVYALQALRRRAVNTALASWSLILAGISATIVLLVLGVLGLTFGGLLHPAIAVPLAVVIAAAAVVGWCVATHPNVLYRCLRAFASTGRRLPGLRERYSGDDVEIASQRVTAQIRLLRPTPGRWSSVIGLAALSWILDFVSLATSVAATGRQISWPVILVGFLVVQGSIAVQVFPGGGGLAEAGLFGVLIGSGLAFAPAAIAVMVYRLINWIGLALLGWVVYGVRIRKDAVARPATVAHATGEQAAHHCGA